MAVLTQHLPLELLRANVHAVKTAGYDVAPLHALQLPAEVFLSQPIASTHYIALTKAVSTVTQCRHLLNEEAHYFDQGKSVQDGNPWLFWMSTLHCATWGDMLIKQCDLGKRMGFTHRQLIQQQDNSFFTGFIRYNFDTPIDDYLLQLNDLCHLYLFYRVNSWFLDELLPVEAVHIMGQDHGIKPFVEQLFDAPVVFNRTCFALQHNSHFLKRKINRTPQDIEQLCQNPGQCFAQTKTSVRDETTETLSQLLIEKPELSLNDAAIHLHCSKDTVTRRLRRVDLSFQQLKDQCRSNAAKELLQASELSIEQISSQLAFSNPPAFTRAFKKWIGLTPSTYRKEHYNR